MVSIRDEIAELGREQDALLSEHEQWLARRQAECEAPMRKSDADGVMYRTTEQNAQVAAPAAVSEPSDADGRLFGDWRDQALAENLGVIIAETRKELRAEYNKALVVRDKRIVGLERQIHELRGKLNAVSAELEAANRDRAATHALTVRLARLEGLFAGKMSHLAGLADAAGLLPRGYE